MVCCPVGAIRTAVEVETVMDYHEFYRQLFAPLETAIGPIDPDTIIDEKWVRLVVSDIGRMTLETAFGNDHTMDIGEWVGAGAPLQGVVFDEASRCRIGGVPFGVMRVVGVTHPEME
jgi:hypothetical protein